MRQRASELYAPTKRGHTRKRNQNGKIKGVLAPKSVCLGFRFHTVKGNAES